MEVLKSGSVDIKSLCQTSCEVLVEIFPIIAIESSLSNVYKINPQNNANYNILFSLENKNIYEISSTRFYLDFFCVSI